MLFTWNTNNLCIVFRQWHIRSTLSLVVSLLAVVGIGIGYEALRSVSRSYEMYISGQVDALPSKSFFYTPTYPPSPFHITLEDRSQRREEKKGRRVGLHKTVLTLYLHVSLS